MNFVLGQLIFVTAGEILECRANLSARLGLGAPRTTHHPFCLAPDGFFEPPRLHVKLLKKTHFRLVAAIQPGACTAISGM
jgi:hypothetical protein